MDTKKMLEIRGAGGGCFPGHVCVTTPDGPVPISEIKVGDTVVAFDDRGHLYPAPVLAVHIHENHPITRYRLWGGMVLDATDNHWVLNQFNAFVAIGTLGPDDCLVDARDHLRPIVSKEPLEPATVYNLTVEGFHTFIADGIRVHNAGLGGDIRGAGGDSGKGGGGGQSRNPVEAPNNLFSVAFAKTLLAVSEGEIEGFPSGVPAKDIYLDGTQIQRNDGGFNFQNVTIEYRSGTDSQTPIPGFSQVENTVSVATEVTQNVGPVTRTITDPDIERIRVIIQHPSLQSVNTSTGDTNPTSVTYQISVSSNGGPFITQAEPTVSGKSSGQFQRAYEFDLPVGGAPWQVRVTRLTADSTSSFLSNSVVWQAYTEIVDEKFAYPNTALLGIRVDARQFNNIPDVTVKLKGKRVQIPTNYDPLARTYTGFWDGSWKTAWTDNPAWIFRDLVLNPIYGVRRYLPQISVDPFYLYTVSQYCDELVPNGLGSQEPRFRCNLFLQNTGSVFEVLNSLASVFRGLLYYEGGKLYVTQDRPGVPVQQFSEANVVQEVDDRGIVTSPCFSYAGSSRTARKSVVLANWDDPEQRFNSVVEYQQDDELLARFGYNPIDLRLIGVTSRGQALRAAKFALFTNRYETEKVSFRVAAEGLAAGIGEIIQIADPGKQGQRIAGRIKAINGNEVTLDAPLTLNSGIAYTLTLVNASGITTTQPDGSTYTEPRLSVHNVVGSRPETLGMEMSFLLTQNGHPIVTQKFQELGGNNASEYGNTVIKVDEVITAQPSSLWVLEWQDFSASLYRIISISETEPLRFLIEAIQYNESKYGYIDNSLPIAIPKDRYLVRDVQPPTDLTARLDYRNGAVRINAKWLAPQLNGVDDPQVSQFRYQYRQIGSEAWSEEQRTPYTNAEIILAQFTVGLNFQFRVASRNRLGQQSNWLQVDVQGLDPIPNLADPIYNASVRHQNQPDGSQLVLISHGTLPLPERVEGYRVWAKPLNATAPIPGVQSPEADGFYLLSANVPLSGYYAISFHLPCDYLVRVALRSAIPGEEPTDYLFDSIYRLEIVPPKLDNFTVVEAQNNKAKRFSWQVPRSTFGSWDKGIVSDIVSYKVRFKQGNLVNNSIADTWAIGMDLFAGGIPGTQTQFETSLIDTDQFVVMIKAVDATKWESDEAAYVILNTQPPLVENVVETGSLVVSAAENQFFNCALTNVWELITQSGNYIINQSGSLAGAPASTYIQQIDITQDAYFTWLISNGNLMSSLLLSTTANATYQHFLAALMGSELTTLAETGNTVLLESGGDLYLEQQDLSAAILTDTPAGVLRPYAPMEKLTMSLYRVRTMFRSRDGVAPGSIVGVSYQLDYSDLFETFNDVVLAGGTGSTINLTKTFRSVRGVQATIQDTGTGAVSIVVTAKSTASVSLKALNAAGSVVSAKVDVVVQGY